MKNLLLALCLITAININAQTTAIPDANFEQALIDLGYDTGFIDGIVLTNNIDTVTNLNVFNKNIGDLTGIEDFTALTVLDCSYNQLTSLDLTQNTALSCLECRSNQLTSLVVTQNTALTQLLCLDNQLTSLDVTQNTALTILSCGNNQLTSLDLTQNTALTNLACYDNQLTCLNVKNGNNLNFIYFDSSFNPNLNCVEVDDINYSKTNWTNIDTQTSFSTNCNNDCSVVGIEESSLSNLSLYPNPTSGSITIDLEETKSNLNLSLTNALGQVVLTKNYTSTNRINIDLDAPKGVYFLQLESNGEVITKKIIKE